MKKLRIFSIARFRAMLAKEFIQMRRDRLTFAMMIGIPLLQLILFGYAINADPKHLPAAVLVADHGPEGRTLFSALQNSGYYELVRQVKTEAEGHDLLARGRVQFVINIPENFSRDFLRGDRPELLVEADATDPGTTGNAIGSLSTALNTALKNDLKGPLESLAANDGPIDLRVHALYNPEAITHYNIVPGLMGVVLTLTMILVTGLAITRERERGTMENLLSMPTRPIEVLVGKLVPYILVGYVQVTLILLAVGITFSTIAQNQLQAMQMTFFFFLPSLLLSGFAFPFRGMPGWAQAIGEVLPLTHFVRIVRGILLKGNGIGNIGPELWPIALFAAVAMFIAMKRYRQTLD